MFFFLKMFYVIPFILAIVAYFYIHLINATPKKIPLSVNYHLTRQCYYVGPFHFSSVLYRFGVIHGDRVF